MDVSTLSGTGTAGTFRMKPVSPASLRSGCKINIGLAITGVREDGYHLLDSVFWPLSDPHDVLDITPAEEPGIHIVTDAQGIDPEKNTLTKIWKAFSDATGLAPALTVRLTKGVPWGAGLGGGSADAATLLRYLAGYTEPALTGEQLKAIAVRVGADVPFFLQDRPLRVRGIGDILEPCTLTLPGRELVLVTPGVSVSTPWAYGAWDRMQSTEKGPQKAREQESLLTTAEAAYTDSSLPHISVSALTNDLEAPVFSQFPELARIKAALIESGALIASMTGSGSGIYGIFKDAAEADHAASQMAGSWRAYHISL